MNTRLQAQSDVECLHKIAERITLNRDLNADCLAKLQLAKQSLQLIATWADVKPFDDRTMGIIMNRAIDTLKLIESI